MPATLTQRRMRSQPAHLAVEDRLAFEREARSRRTMLDLHEKPSVSLDPSALCSEDQRQFIECAEETSIAKKHA